MKAQPEAVWFDECKWKAPTLLVVILRTWPSRELRADPRQLLHFGSCAVLALLVGMGFEVGFLVCSELLGLVGEIFAAFDGFLERQVEAGLAGQSAQNTLPARVAR